LSVSKLDFHFIFFSIYLIEIYYRIKHRNYFKNGYFDFYMILFQHQQSLLIFSQLIITKSFLFRYPLVSGIYRFATFVMNICLKLDYFKVIIIFKKKKFF